jgi:hypothetical protein
VVHFGRATLGQFWRALKENCQQRDDEKHDAGAKVSDPASDTKAGDVDRQNRGEQPNVERHDEGTTVGHPGCAGAKRIAEARGRHDAEIRQEQQGPRPEVPGADEAGKRADGVLGPLVDAAFQRPNPDAVAHDRGRGQEEQGGSKQPEGNVSTSLAGGDAGPGDTNDEQDLHRDQVTQPERFAEGVACGFLGGRRVSDWLRHRLPWGAGCEVLARDYMGGTEDRSSLFPISRCIGGRPARRAYVQRFAVATRRRCHRSSVAGVMMKDRQRARGRSRLVAAKEQPVDRRYRLTAILPTQDGEFMSQHDDFQVFEVVRATAQGSQLEDAKKHEVTQREQPGAPCTVRYRPILRIGSLAYTL